MNSQIFSPLYPKSRMRRLRKSDFILRMLTESNLSTNNLIFPLFVVEGHKIKEQVSSMPGIYVYSIDEIIPVAEKCMELGIPTIALFPVIDSELKTNNGIESINSNGLIPRAVVEIKKHFPELGIMTDVALDPYTIHGQDGILDNNGYVLNDETIEMLTKQSLLHASVGVDIVAPSDMMDGRIGIIRQELEANLYKNTIIMAYSAKYSSAFYGPFRDAIRSTNNLKKGNKNSYQINPSNIDEAIREAAADITEGADMLIVKPGMPYLDVLAKIKEKFRMPTFAYQVSGEYSMIKAASLNGWIKNDEIILETLICFRRAGADGILTYFALEAAELLRKSK